MVSPEEMLIYVVYAGDFHKALTLLKNNVNINYTNENGLTPLLVASERGDFQMTKLLVDHGADCNIGGKFNIPLKFHSYQQTFEMTPLINAAAFGSKDIAKLLIENGAEVNFRDEGGRSALTFALEHGRKNCAELLIQNGAEVYQIDFIIAADKCSSINLEKLVHEAKKTKKVAKNRSVSMLHSAAQDGDRERLRELIKKGVNLNLEDKDGNTALHVAIENNYLECAELLIKKGASVNIQNKNMVTPLHIAAHHGLASIISNLVENGANVDAKGENEITPLHMAVFNSFLLCVKQLLNYGANVNAVFADGKTALHVAISNSPECIEFLMKENADIFAKDSLGVSPLQLAIEFGLDMFKNIFPGKYNVSNVDGVTPLHIAAYCLKSECLQQMIDDGCDVNVVDDHGDTPLHIVCSEVGSIKTIAENEKLRFQKNIELLIKAGAKINQKNNMGMAPIHLCAIYDFIEALKVLIEFGAEINSPSGHKNQTPLHHATEMGYLNCIKYLIKNGADSSVANSENCSALMLAAKNNHFSCVKFLLQNNAPFWIS